MNIRLVTDNDWRQCNDLHNRVHGRNRTLRQCQWEFVHNTFPGARTPYAVVEDGGRIVGTQALIPIRMIDNDGVYWTAKSEETLVDPAFRGKRLLDQMYEMLFDFAAEHKFACIWGLTGVIAAAKTLGRLGFIFPCTTEQIFMPFSSRSIPALLGIERLGVKENGGNTLKVLALRGACVAAQTYSLLRVARKRNPTIAGMDVRTMVEPDPQAGEVCRRFISTWGGATIYRDAEYLRWRLFDNPYVRCIVRAVYHQDNLLGWVAYTLGDDGMGYLVDLIVAGDNARYAADDQVRLLLLEAVEGTRRMGATGIRGWKINNHPFDRLICRVAKSLGFYHIKRGNTAVLCSCDSAGSPTSRDKFDDWFVSRIYTEGLLG